MNETAPDNINPYEAPRIESYLEDPPDHLLKGKYLKYGAPLIRYEFKEVVFNSKKNEINAKIDLRSGVPLRMLNKVYAPADGVDNLQFQIKEMDLDKIKFEKILSFDNAIELLKNKMAGVTSLLRQFKEVDLTKYDMVYPDHLNNIMSNVIAEVKAINKKLYQRNQRKIENDLDGLLDLSEHISALDNVLANGSTGNPLIFYSSSTVNRDNPRENKLNQIITDLVCEYNHDRTNDLLVQYTLANKIAWDGVYKQTCEQGQGCLVAAAKLPFKVVKHVCLGAVNKVHERFSREPAESRGL